MTCVSCSGPCRAGRRSHGLPPAPERKRTTTWSAFIRIHLALLVGTDFFTAEVLTLRGLVTYYVLFFIHLESRRVNIAGITVHPDERWMQQAARNVTMPRGLLWAALVAGVLAIGVQVYEFGHLGFDPQQGGGYPSVFVGLKGSLLVQFAGALLWLLTHIAQARPAGDFLVRRASATLFSYFLLFLAGIGVIAYLVLYFV